MTTHGPHPGGATPANDRLKTSFSAWLWSSLIVATVVHFAAFALWPTLTAEVAVIDGDILTVIDVPDEIDWGDAVYVVLTDDRPAIALRATADRPDLAARLSPDLAARLSTHLAARLTTAPLFTTALATAGPRSAVPVAPDPARHAQRRRFPRTLNGLPPFATLPGFQRFPRVQRLQRLTATRSGTGT